MTQMIYTDGMYKYYGVSTDTKPNPESEVAFAGAPVIFTETDTGNQFIWDYGSGQWNSAILQPGGSSPAPTPTPIEPLIIYAKPLDDWDDESFLAELNAGTAFPEFEMYLDDQFASPVTPDDVETVAGAFASGAMVFDISQLYSLDDGNETRRVKPAAMDVLADDPYSMTFESVFYFCGQQVDPSSTFMMASAPELGE